MRKPFCNLISLFLSIKRDQDSVMNFWDEMYGCVNYLNLPYDTVMNLPVYVRKFWIKKHNRQVEEEQAEMERAKAGQSAGDFISGEGVNAFAEMEQRKQR